MSPILGILASQISGRLTPTTGFCSIATTTVGAGGSSTITFSAIPQVYKHLQLRWIARDTTATNDAQSMVMRLNTDSSAVYTRHYLLGDGTGIYAGGSANITALDGGLVTGGGMTASSFSAGIIDILDYQDTNKFKTARVLTGQSTNASTPRDYIELESGLWRSTSAVSTITLTLSTGNYAQYSSFALYGIQGA